MRFAIRVMSNLTGVALIAIAAGCGGGPSIEATSVPSTIEVRVSAGAPVVGATVTVYAISDATGQVNNAAGAGGVLGSAGPTDATGKVTLSVSPYSGPVQIVAGGPAVTYADPTAAAGQNGVGPVIQVPSSFLFTSFIAKFKPGTPVPLTFLTTLADRAALAFAHGLHPSHPSKATISEALAARDPLFVTHITNAPAAWSPGALRWTMPAPLHSAPQSLVDAAFAALFDVALNQLARDTAAQAGYGDTGGLTAPTLMQLLQDDIDADGRLDGLTFGGRTVSTAGSTPVVMDAQFLHKPLAVALLGWVRNTAANKSGISDADLASALVFKTIVEDTSDLFGPIQIQSLDPLDRTPPALTLVSAPSAYANGVNARVIVSAADASGTKAVYAQVGATRLAANLIGGNWQVDVFLQTVGHNTITIWGEDLAQPTSNSGLGRGSPFEIVLDVVFDPDAPRATYDATVASYFDERGMTVAIGADGLALVPATYVGGPKVPVALGGDIFKSATRVAAGAPFDAHELETTNAGNIPILRFVVPYNDKVDSPIAKAEYTVTATCPGCGTISPVHGILLPSPNPGVGALAFDLPLSSETVPALAAPPGPMSLEVSLDLADAAGNSSKVGGFTFTFHVVGPPVAVTEDVAFPTYNGPSKHLSLPRPGNGNRGKLLRDSLRPRGVDLLRRAGEAGAVCRQQSVAPAGRHSHGLRPVADWLLEGDRGLAEAGLRGPTRAESEKRPGPRQHEAHRRLHVLPGDLLGHSLWLSGIPGERAYRGGTTSVRRSRQRLARPPARRSLRQVELHDQRGDARDLDRGLRERAGGARRLPRTAARGRGSAAPGCRHRRYVRHRARSGRRDAGDPGGVRDAPDERAADAPATGERSGNDERVRDLRLRGGRVRRELELLLLGRPVPVRGVRPLQVR